MSGPKGIIRKYYDKGPTAITSNGNYDGSGSPSTAWNAGVQPGQWLTDLIQSDDDTGRIGQSIAVEALDLRVNISPQPSVVGYQTIRMLLVADNEQDGAIPTIQEILGPTAVSMATGLMLECLQPGYFGRFHIIEDKYWKIYSSSTANTFTETFNHSLWHDSHHDLKGHRVMWDASDASAIANARKGHIFLYFLYETTVASTGGLPTTTFANPPVIQYKCRIRFRDTNV